MSPSVFLLACQGIAPIRGKVSRDLIDHCVRNTSITLTGARTLSRYLHALVQSTTVRVDRAGKA